MSAWVQFVKQYQKENGLSYKEALKQAGPHYKKTDQQISGGKINLKTVKKTINKGAKKLSKGTKKTSKFIDKNTHYLDYINPDLGKDLGDFNEGLKSVSSVSDKVVSKTGGNLKTVARKAKNTVNRIKKESKKANLVLDRVSPMVAMVNPEAGASLQAVSKGLNAINGGKLGSKNNKYMVGGSFKTPTSYGGSFKTPMSYGGSGRSDIDTKSSLIHVSHPSFRPLKEKSVAERLKYN